MQDALTLGDTRMFDLIGEPESVLMLAINYSRQEQEGLMARVWFHEPVLYCPFCGTHLQSEDAVEAWRRKMTT